MRKFEILCYGDSNTYGSIAKDKPSDCLSLRYSEDIRWTGLVSKALGDSFHIIEEGLGGRTTSYELGRAPFDRYANGLKHIVPVLMTHTPLDLVIVMLGTNDLQSKTPLDENSLGKGIASIVDEIYSIPQCGFNNIPPKILIISPIHVEYSRQRSDVYDNFGREKGISLSKKFASAYSSVANEKGCFFLDASLYASPSKVDGIHLDSEGHRSLASAIVKKIELIFNN